MKRTNFVLSIVAVLVIAGCQSGNGDAEHDTVNAAVPPDSALLQYNREYIFLAPRAAEPLVVPIVFASRSSGAEIERTVHGWLARGAMWDHFLDESGETSNAGGVWRVVPRGALTITVGGSTEIETLRFARGDRHLRLELDSLLTGWNQEGETRFRLIKGNLDVGPESFSGPVLEVMRVEQTLDDGWPPGQDFDVVFLTSGDSLQLVVAETLADAGEGQRYAWLRTPAEVRAWKEGEIRWLDVRSYDEARRDIPTRWSIRVPAADVVGELEAVGFDSALGPERGGRKAIEIRYTVRGWIEIQGSRRSVTGTIRHTQQ
jgi:hypothetical protein